MENYFEDLEYAVLKNRYQIKGRAYEHPHIVLKDKETRLVVCFTNYSEYVLSRLPRDSYKWSVNLNWAYAITQFLNYILHKYGIQEVENVKAEMVQEFLDDYCSTLYNGSYPSRGACNEKRAAVCIFLWSVCYEREINPTLPQMQYLKRDDLLGRIAVKGEEGMRVMPEYHFYVKCHNNESGLKQLYRDMPLQIAPKFLQAAQVYDPELTFAIALSMFAGLREGEICNVRQKNSPYGPGVYIMHDGETYRSFTIDLRQEYVIRDDGKFAGKIKKERLASVYPRFLNIIQFFYLQHLNLIAGKKTDKSCPMFINKKKNIKAGTYPAMTVSGYRERIRKLFWDHVMPALKNSPEKNLQLFYYQMQNHSWGAHAFRHWYTVFLVLDGCSDVELKDWRGDRSILSSQTYLERKGELQKKYAAAVNQISLKMLQEGII